MKPLWWSSCWEINNPCFVLWTASGEFDVISFATPSAVASSWLVGTRVFTLFSVETERKDRKRFLINSSITRKVWHVQAKPICRLLTCDRSACKQYFRSKLSKQEVNSLQDQFKTSSKWPHAELLKSKHTWWPAIWDKRGIPILKQGSNNFSILNLAHSPPCAATTPRFTSGKANLASSLAITISQFKIISKPPP